MAEVNEYSEYLAMVKSVNLPLAQHLEASESREPAKSPQRRSEAM